MGRRPKTDHAALELEKERTRKAEADAREAARQGAAQTALAVERDNATMQIEQQKSAEVPDNVDIEVGGGDTMSTQKKRRRFAAPASSNMAIRI